METEVSVQMSVRMARESDAQLVREWNDCRRVTGESNSTGQIWRAVRRQSKIEREQTERMIRKMKGAKHE